MVAVVSCQKPFLEEYEAFVNTACACETKACVDAQLEQASRNDRFLQEGAADPARLVAKYGEAYRELDEKLRSCLARFDSAAPQ